jgi:hypothetical protein
MHIKNVQWNNAINGFILIVQKKSSFLNHNLLMIPNAITII